jgi:8-oxo-dGTP pyrophosphatase MutT (NUDIX family)
MYKVFIDNKAFFFISNEDFNKYQGIFISDSFILNEKEFILKTHADSPKNMNVYIVSPQLETSFKSFFKEYQFIEAAGGIVCKGDAFLFIKRNDFWDIPKGKMEQNESPEITAYREIEEECGIQNLVLKSHISTTYHTYHLKGKDYLKKTHWYAFDYKGNKLGSPQNEEGITEIAWLKKSELSKVKENTFQSILDVIDSYF